MAILDKFTEQIIAENVDFETFLRDYADQFTELVGGKVIKMSPVTDRHDEIVRFLGALLDAYLESTGEGKLRQQPFLMKTRPEAYGREPDLLVVTTPNLEKLKPTYLDGAADLVIEVVSLESVDRDRGEKFREYEEIGVHEYWIVDPIRKETLFYVLQEDEDGVHYNQNAPDQNGTYSCAVLPRLKFKPTTLLKLPVPSVRDAVRLVDEMLAE